MVRIKGANSDYVYTGNPQEFIKEQKDADPLYLKIFICPYDMPSRVEPNQGQVCEGTDAECPHGENSSGHALICLHEKEGISLVTNNQIAAQGIFVVKTQDGKDILLEVSSQSISMKISNGAEITINQQGDIELSPGNHGKVKINGDLEVTGEITTAVSKLTNSIQILEKLAHG